METDSHGLLNARVPAHLLALGIGFAATSTLLYGLGLEYLAALHAAAGLASITILWWSDPQHPHTIKSDRDETTHVTNPERYFVSKEDIDVTPKQELYAERNAEGNATGGDESEAEPEGEAADTERVRAD